MGMTWGVRRLRQRGVTSTPEKQPAVLQGCEAFLRGQLLNDFSADLESAPDWVWISVLAHASEEYLASFATRCVRPRPTNRCVWDRTLSYLSEMLFDQAAQTGLSVTDLQHEIIVPI